MRISDGMREAEKSAKPFISILMYLTLGAVIVGVLAGVATTITGVPAALVTFLNGTWITNIVSYFTSFGVVIGTVVSLIIVGILWYMFMGKKGKKGSSL